MKKKQPDTTIVVDNVSGFDTVYNYETINAIRIDNEFFEILPLESKEGTLLLITDEEKKKGALLRVKRNL